MSYIQNLNNNNKNSLIQLFPRFANRSSGQDKRKLLWFVYLFKLVVLTDTTEFGY